MGAVPLFRRPGAAPDDDLTSLTDRQLHARYRSVSLSLDAGGDPAARAVLADALAAEVLRRDPGSAEFWYDRGMLAKWRRDWVASRELNATALDLVPARRRQGEPAAWNLGIAATALHDWDTAHRAWTAFGIDLPPRAAGAPVSADFGPAPVRLNAEPRFVGEPALEVDGRTWDVEVVWGRRLCPTRIRILNVPTPASGHRFGDVVLHDGDTLGTRLFGEHELGVFNEIALWERSRHATVTVTVDAPDGDAVEELADLCDAEGGAAEDWTANMRQLCRACSEGSPHDTHDHAPEVPGWQPARSVGLAADPAEIDRLLDRWAAGGPGRDYRDVEVALP